MTTSLNTTMQAAVSGMTTVMAVSIFAQAIGVLMASAELGMAPLGQVPPEKGIADLRSIYGDDVVNKAIKSAGKDADIISLAMAVESIAWDDLESKYGSFAVDAAREACGIIDFRCAKEVAAAMTTQKVTPTSPPEKKEQAVTAGKRRGRQPAQPVKDTKTGITYESKARAGMAVAAEYGLDPKNHFIWYEVIKKDSTRFVRA